MAFIVWLQYAALKMPMNEWISWKYQQLQQKQQQQRNITLNSELDKKLHIYRFIE